jgi:hypothetical protein
MPSTMVKRVATGIEDRRIEVDRLLREGLDLKLLRASTKDATERIAQAYKLATQEPRLPSPWPAAAAYRLAHVKFRLARIPDELEDVEELFNEAARDESLGARPLLYQLAALHRLDLAYKEAGRDPDQLCSLGGRIKRTLGVARKRLRCVEGTDRGEEKLAQPRQGELLNLLELATYFLGEAYEPIEGARNPYDDLFPPANSWFLVGPNREISKVRYPRGMAMAELEARERASPCALLIQLDDDGHESWRMAGERRWIRANPRGAVRLIAHLLEGSTQDDLEERVVGEEGTSELFRQILFRARRKIGEFMGRDPAHTIVEDHPTGLRKIADGLNIFGAVNQNQFYSLPRK